MDQTGKGTLVAWWRITSPGGVKVLKSGVARTTKAGKAPKKAVAKAAPRRRAMKKITCTNPGCTAGWYRPSGKAKRLCYKHHLAAGGKPSVGWRGPHK